MTAVEWAQLEADPRVHIASSGSWLDAEPGADQ